MTDGEQLIELIPTVVGAGLLIGITRFMLPSESFTIEKPRIRSALEAAGI